MYKKLSFILLFICFLVNFVALAENNEKGEPVEQYFIDATEGEDETEENKFNNYQNVQFIDPDIKAENEYQVNNPQEIDSILKALVNESDNSSINEEIKAESVKNNLESHKHAKIIILNKITAKSTTETFIIGKPKKFGNLTINLKKCITNKDPYKLNHFTLITVYDQKPEQETPIEVFSGWLVSSEPSISTVEHPVYEVIPVECFH